MADRFVSVAGSGSNSGLDEANSWTMAQATANAVAGNIHHCKAGTYIADDSSSSSVMDIDVAGTAVAWIEWRGYTTTINDFNIGDTPPAVINAGTNTLTNCMQTSTLGNGNVFNRFRGLQFTGASGDGAGLSSTSDFAAFEGCKFDNNGDRGFQGDNTTTFIGCEFTLNSIGALDCDLDTVLIACKFHNENTSNTTVNTQNAIALGCLFYNNGNGSNIATSGMPTVIAGNTFDGDNSATSTGAFASGSLSPTYYNNIFYDLNNGVDLSGGSAKDAASKGFNLFSSCTNNYDTIADDKSDIDDGTTDPFTDSAGRDYTLASGSAAIDAGIDGDLSNASMDIGAIQNKATGGGGTGGIKLVGNGGGLVG